LARTQPEKKKKNEDSRREDLELVRRVVKGDQEAFRALFDKHRGRVYSIAYRFTRNREDALEIVQEVFIKVHRAIDTFDARSSFSTWICRITTNASIDWTRRRKGEHYEFREEILGPDQEDASPIVPRTENPHDAAMRSELREKIRSAVDRLSEKHGSIFLLHVVEGLSYQEIADLQGIPIGTVMSRLHYARKYLRDFLRPYLGTGDDVERAGSEA